MVLTTGEVAEQAGVHIETVRYYERRGLLPKPPRNSSGHRQYDREAVRRLHFIKRAQELGFSLDEIKQLMSLRAEPDAPNIQVKRKTEQKLEETQAKINDLERIQTKLEELVAACDGQGTTSECPILDALEMPESLE